MSSNTPSPSARRVFSGPPGSATSPSHDVTSLSRRSSVASTSPARRVPLAGHGPNPSPFRPNTSDLSNAITASRAPSSSIANTPSRQGSVRSQVRLEDTKSGNTSNLVSDFARLSLPEYPKRPGYGTLGNSVRALTNSFPIDLSNAPDLSQYTFTIEGAGKDDSAIGARTRARALFLLLWHNPNFQCSATNYTSTIVSTTTLIPAEDISKTFVVDYYESEESGPRTGTEKLQFSVTLQFLRTLYIRDLKTHLANQSISYPQLEEHLTAINTMFSRFPAQDPQLASKAQRDIFFDITQREDRSNLGQGLKAFRGYFKSARLTQSGLRLLVNVTTSAFYTSCPLHKLIDQLRPTSDFEALRERLVHLDRMLRFLRVTTTYTGRPVVKTVLGVARCEYIDSRTPTADNITFLKNDTSVSVAHHFRATYPRVSRNDPAALVVKVAGGRQPVYIPSDLCTVVPGQLFRGPLLNSSQTSNMIRFACRPPHINQESILNGGLSQIGVHKTGGPRDRFRLNVGNQMVQIDARILPKPVFKYHNGSDGDVGTGSWTMKGKRFLKAPLVSLMRISWLEFVLPGAKGPENTSEFLRRMGKALSHYTGHSDLQIENLPNFQHRRTFHPSDDYKTMTSIFTDFFKRQIRLVIVFLPSKAPQYYQSIKTAADARVGIHTVCCWRFSKNLNTLNTSDDFLANQSIKINSKLGGINLTLDRGDKNLAGLLRRRLMFVGADVVHPGKTAMDGAPSVAAVVASIDDHYSLYPGSYTLQTPDNKTKRAIEWITQFGVMMKSRLKLYCLRNNGYLPEIIFIYRDGVGDSMFAEVLQRELVQVQQACKEAYCERRQAMPKIEYLVVTKRIHNRFYQPPSSRARASGFDEKGNPLPGFVVDGQITSGKLWDWFMVSHKCLQGTSVPKHYVVLHDELNIGVDQLQYLTHAMCFLLPRCTRAISVHVAARAADLMCDRAKIYLHSVYSPPVVAPNADRPKYADGQYWPGTIASDLEHTMFYI